MNLINGLPAHVLIVHAVVVLVPLAALMSVLSVVWPAARHRMGIMTPVIALLGLIATPLATGAGEWLQAHVRDTSLVRRHAELGDQLLPFATVLFVLAAGLWLLDEAKTRGWKLPSLATAGWVRPVASALLVVAAVGSVAQVYRIGDSGAKAAWHNQYSADVITHVEGG